MNNSQPSDEYLINCIQGGNIEKASILFDRHHRNIFTYFYRLTRCRAESEDMTQNVFVRLIRYNRTYKTGHQFLPWVFSIAHNVFIDYCNYRNKEINCLKNYNKQLNDEDTDVQNDQLERFYMAFEQLPIEYRELLVMNRYHDLSYKQIGEALGVNEKAIKQKAFRAMEKLRKEFYKLETVED